MNFQLKIFLDLFSVHVALKEMHFFFYKLEF